MSHICRRIGLDPFLPPDAMFHVRDILGKVDPFQCQKVLDIYLACKEIRTGYEAFRDRLITYETFRDRLIAYRNRFRGVTDGNT